MLHSHQLLQAISVLESIVLLRKHKLIWPVVVPNFYLSLCTTEVTNPLRLHRLQTSTQDRQRLAEAAVEEDPGQSTKREPVHHSDKVHQPHEELDHLVKDEIAQWHHNRRRKSSCACVIGLGISFILNWFLVILFFFCLSSNNAITGASLLLLELQYSFCDLWWLGTLYVPVHILSWAITV